MRVRDREREKERERGLTDMNVRDSRRDKASTYTFYVGEMSTIYIYIYIYYKGEIIYIYIYIYIYMCTVGIHALISKLFFVCFL